MPLTWTPQAEAEAAWTSLLVAAVTAEARRATLERLAAGRTEAALNLNLNPQMLRHRQSEEHPLLGDTPPLPAAPTELRAPAPPSLSAPAGNYALSMSAAAEWPPVALPPPPRALCTPSTSLAVAARGMSGKARLVRGRPPPALGCNPKECSRPQSYLMEAVTLKNVAGRNPI